MGQRILITGTSRFLGGMLAKRLESDPDVETIIGVDTDPPLFDFERVEIVRADIRNPLFVKVLQTTRVDTVVHANVVADELEIGRGPMKEVNVIGSMQVLAACQKAQDLRRVVVRSSTEVYGSEPDGPAFFTEEMGPRGNPKTGYHRDILEVEQYSRDFGRRRPDVSLCVLRYANILGNTVDNPMSQYLGQPVVPTLLGFDPRIQFIHEDDAVEVLVRAVKSDVPGIFNVAADDAIYLSQAIRLAGRIHAPVLPPSVALAARLLGLLPFVPVPVNLVRYLAYGRVSDNTRLKTVFGYEPRYTVLDAIHDFALKKRAERMRPEPSEADWEEDLRRFIDRKLAETTETAGPDPAPTPSGDFPGGLSDA
ncbi:MAG: NAD-dependent epimerase/dehydratase family protein [Actinobacteria bacterium ATB1]|nr:NAD-dependent epimerase/dehydratase family protein [Actinobacteria bacterium ATB1]